MLVLTLVLVNTAGMQGIIILLSPSVTDPFHSALDRVLAAYHPWTNYGIVTVVSDTLAASCVMLVLFSLLKTSLENRHASGRIRQLVMALVVATIMSWSINLAVPTVGPANHEKSFSAMADHADIDMRFEDQRLSSEPFSATTTRNASVPLDILWMALCLIASFSGSRSLFWRLLPLAFIAAGCGILAGDFYLVDLLSVPAIAAVAWTLANISHRYSSERKGKETWLNIAIVLLGTITLGLGLAMLSTSEILNIFSLLSLMLVLSFLVIRSAIRVDNSDKEIQVPFHELPISKDHLAKKTGINSVLVLFFFSGLTGLVYEVIFERQLALIFGSTARSTTTVLAVYMAGIALGAAIGGKLSDRVRNPLRYYALVEGLVGITCLFAPNLFELANELYLGMVRDSGLSTASMELVQVSCGALVVILPAMLMGTTMPLLAKHATDEMGMIRKNIAYLYSANTLGAATGTILATYWLITTMGIEGSLRLTTLINFSIATIGLWLSGKVRNKNLPSDSLRKKIPMNFGGSYGILLIITAGTVGFTTFGLEILYVHLLAVVVGNSIYAFGLMLFSFLLGLAIGSRWAGRINLSESIRKPFLAASILMLGMVVLLFLPLWDRIPPFLGLYSQVNYAASFAQREFVRFSICVGMMIVPTIIIGMIFPQMVALSTRSIDALGRHVGLVSFSNTIGDILGAVVVGLVFLPLLGSYTTAQVLGMAAVILGGVVLLWQSTRSKWIWSLGSILAGLSIVSLQTGWNLSALTAGTNVYFTYQSYGDTVEYLESIDGGISSIASHNDGTRTVTTMLTNGKFQGDNHDEMLAQCRFAFYPLLHCRLRNKALLIGLGTGVTGGVLLASGFRSLDIAELSADIADLASRYFSDVNGGVLDDPRTNLYITDGRNLLLVGTDRYDLISIEISSIWFAGAANMYNREFYELARDHLAPRGVLQQWIQLHHISPSDVASILATIRSVFPYVVLYFGGYQGVLVASMTPMNVNNDYVEQALNNSPTLDRYKHMIGPGGFTTLMDELLLETDEIDTFVEFVADCAGAKPKDLISTDSNRRLEYSTPKGNVRTHGMRQMVRLLTRFKQ